MFEPQRFEPHGGKMVGRIGHLQSGPKREVKVFSLSIPPPNVTGMLHIGHLLGHTQMDVMTRWHRMLGHNTLWLPGTDHAGIANQMVVERKLAAEGLTRLGLGREEFEKRIWDWKRQYGATITSQMVKIGDSRHWSRERFTMDTGLSRAVRKIFVRLYEKGLILVIGVVSDEQANEVNRALQKPKITKRTWEVHVTYS